MRIASSSTSAGLLLVFSTSCLDHPLESVRVTNALEDEQSIDLQINKDVDILFVIDNSGSMGEEQQNLSDNFGAFIDVLEDPDVRANYRIGITTTDNGNPGCQGTGPEAGSLRLSSCLGRLGEFQSPQGVDARQACSDFCPEGLEDIAIAPTTTLGDPQPVARPWLESLDGVTNLPAGLDTVTAFGCLGPQGIDGCGFESHLESMYKALTRATQAGEDSNGFIRDHAILSIVFVTDEVDCSYNTDHGDMFLPSGSRTFWSLPDDNSPTSAVCWNAGVECTGSAAGVYDDCQPVDLDAAGNRVDGTQAAEAAVLRPVQRYIDLVQKFEDDKRKIDASQQVLVAAISGVPGGYASGDSEIVYQDSPSGTALDPDFQTSYGIGPGCTSSVGEAVPPVRLKAFAEAFEVDGKRNLFSVCDDSYAEALRAIADLIRDRIKPPCMPACVADQDPLTPEIEPLCILTQRVPQGGGDFVEEGVPLCLDAAGTIPEGWDLCYLALGDRENVTATPDDDLSKTCRDDGWNLEFDLVRREGVTVPGGTTISARCALSQDPFRDCPDLPG